MLGVNEVVTDVVVAGLNFNALRMQLETLLLNPGIQPNVVTVSSRYLLFIIPLYTAALYLTLVGGVA